MTDRQLLIWKVAIAVSIAVGVLIVAIGIPTLLHFASPGIYAVPIGVIPLAWGLLMIWYVRRFR
jgi:hypothetical protein